jgi:hypothetical protein
MLEGQAYGMGEVGRHFPERPDGWFSRMVDRLLRYLVDRIGDLVRRIRHRGSNT